MKWIVISESFAYVGLNYEARHDLLQHEWNMNKYSTTVISVEEGSPYGSSLI